MKKKRRRWRGAGGGGILARVRRLRGAERGVAAFKRGPTGPYTNGGTVDAEHELV